MPDRERIFKVLGEAARQPLRTTVGLIVVAIMAVQLLIGAGRERRKYLRVARRLGLRKGEVVSQTFTEGGLAMQLSLASLRPGEWPEVIAAVSARARKAGYRLPQPLPTSGPPPRQLCYLAPRDQDLPNLVLTAYGPGETIEWTDVVVPDGKTGLRAGLT